MDGWGGSIVGRGGMGGWGRWSVDLGRLTDCGWVNELIGGSLHSQFALHYM